MHSKLAAAHRNGVHFGGGGGNSSADSFSAWVGGGGDGGGEGRSAEGAKGMVGMEVEEAHEMEDGWEWCLSGTEAADGSLPGAAVDIEGSNEGGDDWSELDRAETARDASFSEWRLRLADASARAVMIALA